MTSLHIQNSACIETRVWVRTSVGRKCAVQFSERLECVCQQCVLGSLHMHCRPAFWSCDSEWAGLFPIYSSLLLFFFSWQVWMFFSSLKFVRTSTKSSKASALQISIRIMLSFWCAECSNRCCCKISSTDFIFLPSPMSQVCLLCSFDFNVWMVLLSPFFLNMGDGVFEVWKGLVRTEFGKGRRQPLGPLSNSFFFFSLCVT